MRTRFIMLALRRGVIVVAVLAFVLGVAPAIAQEQTTDNGLIDMPDEVGSGYCTPETVGAEELVTCRLPLLFPDDRLPDWGVKGMLSALDVPDWGQDYRLTLCHLDDGWLVCPDLLPDWEEGAQSLFIDLSYDVPHAEVAIERTSDGVLGLSGYTARLPVAFAGQVRTFDVFRSYRLAYGEQASLLVRRAGSDEIFSEVSALAEQDDAASVDITFPTPGRWTITGCMVQAEGGCIREGFRREVNVIDPEPIELVPGHNVVGADRINLLFVRSGWVGEQEAFVDASRRILSLDGYPVRQDEEGEEADPGESAVVLGWGPFAIEPMRGNAHRFNFWYLNDEVDSAAFTRAPTSIGFEGIDLTALGLGDNVATVIMNRTAAYTSILATANHPSFLREIDPGPTEDIRFGSTELPFYFRGAEGATTFSHELGHLLFALADEYVQWDFEDPIYGYPNCAATQEEASQWWGDLEGDLDPMFDRWKRTEEAEGTWWWDDSVADRLRVGFVEGGCFSDSVAAIRPTADSLMNSEVPVFGAVNRRRAEAVLDLWTGRAELDLAVHQDAVDAECELTQQLSSSDVVCGASIGPYLDPPDTIALTLVGSDGDLSASCDLLVEDGGSTVECDPIEIPEGSTYTPVLAAGPQTFELDPVVAAVTATTTTTTTTTTTQPPESEPNGSLPVPLLLAIGAAVLGAGVTVGWQRRQ